MIRRAAPRRRFLALLAAPALFALAGCHSYHVDSSVENRTGAAIQLLEVDYPSASFGKDSLAPGAVYDYRFQIQGNGRLTVQYMTGEGQTVKITGPGLASHQEGRLKIVLLPGGKAEFHPQLSAPR